MKIPSAYVDKKTGEIKKLETLWDKVTARTLPATAQIGLTGLKVGLLAPFVGGLGVVLPAVAVSYVASRWLGNVIGSIQHERGLYNARTPGAISYDLTDPRSLAAFQQKHGAAQPTLAVDVIEMARMLKMEQVPRIIVMDADTHGLDIKQEAQMRMLNHNLAAVSAPDGSNPMLMIGAASMTSVAPKEMRAILGHEFTHLKLGHVGDKYRQGARKSVNGLVGLALLGVAIFGPLPVLPVLGFIVATNIVSNTLDKIKSRHNEYVCDRGAAVLTGGAKDLTTGLAKVTRALQAVQKYIVNRKQAERGLPQEEPKKPGVIKRFLLATHPETESRIAKLDRFGEKYAEYSAHQQSKFAAAFNQAAAKNPPVATIAPRSVDALMQQLLRIRPR